MAFLKDFTYAISGNIVDFRRSARANDMALAPGHGLEVQFEAARGDVVVSVSALDASNPEQHHGGPHIVGGELGNTVDKYNHVPITVELFAANQTTPAERWQPPGGWSDDPERIFRHPVGAANSPIGKWKCVVRNKGTKSAKANLGVTYSFGQQPLRSRPIPRVLLDHTFHIVLEALMPRLRLQGNRIYYRFGEELSFYFPSAASLFQEQSMPIPIDHVEGRGELRTVDFTVTSGRVFLDQVELEWISRKSSYEKALTQAQQLGQQGQTQVMALKNKIRENDEWRAGFRARVSPEAAAIHADVSFSDIRLDFVIRDFDFLIGDITIELAEVKKGTADLYIGFSPELGDAAAFVRTPADITAGLLDALQKLGFFPSLNDLLNSAVSKAIEGVKTYFARYLGEALGKLVAQDCVFVRLNADDQNWGVTYTLIPSGHPRIVTPPLAAGAAAADIVATPLGSLGQIPPEFVIVTPPGSSVRPQTLNKIDHIVVVMMENRSFDHMLGYLGRAYEGIYQGHSNPLSGHAEPVSLRPARNVFPNPPHQVPFSPEHNVDHTSKQIAGGEMSGFAQDYEDAVLRDFGQAGAGAFVMTYYKAEDVWLYDQLAREHAVCDHWFAAFPGGTWPNRWVTLSGKTPELRNLHFDDPRIGYLEGQTIFDVLTRYGISWRIFESDLSLIRTFNRYRLDAENVQPFYNRYDHQKSFEWICKTGQLPSVTFVEPNFTDIPPLSTANDDLAPTDIHRGQLFLSRVVQAVRSAPTWDKTLMLITYDEHGGFYDHVPPPGTPKGPDEWKGRVPALHPSPDPPTNFMGVRVPAIVVSPFVRAGGVCKQVFDHTSIIKTILLRWSDRFPSSVFTQFGPRVNMAADLGLALTEPVAPAQRPAPIARVKVPPAARTPKPATGEFHAILRRGFLPKPGASPR
jgi:phospholipase C